MPRGAVDQQRVRPGRALRERPARRRQCHGGSASHGSAAAAAPASAGSAISAPPRRARRDARRARSRTPRRPRAVDDAEAPRLVGGALEIGGAHAREEGAGLALELVERATLALGALSRRARDTAGRHVEQEREIRLAVAVDPLLQLADARQRHAVAAALVGVGRVGEAVAQHPVAAGERRPDHEVEVLAPRGEHQQRLRCRASSARAAPARAASRPAACRRARALVTTACPRAEICAASHCDVRALAGAVDAFEGDEAAGAEGGQDEGIACDGAAGRRPRHRTGAPRGAPPGQRAPRWYFATARL